MASFQPKIEKKSMDEKIAKVREVVKNVSTNDIVLALHNFELDVGRTIHAFCEGGSETALGDWERTNAGKKRNHKKKPKSNDSRSSGNTTKEVSEVTTPSVASTTNCSVNGYSDNFADKPSLSNGFGIAAVDPADSNGVPSVFSLGKQHFAPIAMTDSNRSQATPQHPAPTNPFKDDIADNDNTYGLVDYQSHLAQNKDMFEQEVASAQANIYLCFKEVRDALTIREQQLLAELTRCRKDGHAYFESRKTALLSLIGESDQAKSSNKSFVSKLEKFNTEKTEDLETALSARFLYDNSSFVSSISQLGKVVPVKLNDVTVTANGKDKLPAAPVDPRIKETLKRSQSPSSLVSSIGEDSGLGGQISPVIHEKGPVVQVEENGIMLKSDSISADQLAEIQRQIVESFKAKGIDPSILSNINTTVPRRRPAPNAQTKNGTTTEKTVKAAKGAGGQQRNGNAPPKLREHQQNGGEKRK